MIAAGILQGGADADRMFAEAPEAAREQLAVELAIIARDFLALQQTRAPEDTGALEGGLGIQLLLDQLRVRVGLLDLKSGRSDLFYGRIIEFGRRAQTVLVQRRRRVNGRLRTSRGRKRPEDISATYPLNVRARAEQPFVLVSDPDIDAVSDQRLVGFWDGVLGRMGAGA